MVACHRTPPPVVVVGDARIVGTFRANVASFASGENQNGDYFIVNRAFTVRFYRALWDLELARKEIERLRKIIEGK